MTAAKSDSKGTQLALGADESLAAKRHLQVLSRNGLAVWQWNMSDNHFFLSEAFCRLASIDKSKLPATFEQLLQLFGKEQQAVLMRYINSAIKTPGRRFDCELQLLDSDNSLTIGGACESSHREVVGYIAKSVAVTTSGELTGVSPMFNALFLNSQTPTCIADPSGLFVRANKRCENLFHVTAPQLEQRLKKFNIFAESTCPTEKITAARELLGEGESVYLNLDYDLAHVLDRQPGTQSTIYLRAHLEPVLDIDGALSYLIVQYEDRSIEKRARLALARNTHLMAEVVGHRGAPPTAVKDLRGTYLIANEQYRKMMAPNVKSLIGQRDQQLLDDDLALLFERREQEVISSQITITAEQLLTCGKVQSTPFLWSCFPVCDDEGEIFAVGHSLTDISDLREQQQLVDLQRTELRLLLDHVQDIIFYLDRWGRVKNSNTQAEVFFGDAYLQDKNLVEVFANCEQGPQLQRDVMQVVRTSFAEIGQRDLIHIDGRDYWFNIDKIPTQDSSGKVSGLMLVMRDVTKETIIEQELRDSESRYRAFISNSMDGIWCCRIEPPIEVTLPLDKQVELLAERAIFSECNQVMAEFRDYSNAEDLLGLPMLEQGSMSRKNSMKTFVQQNYRLLDVETYRDKNSGERLALTESTLGIVEQGQLKHVWGITRDVTEKRRHLAKMEFQASHDDLTGLPNRTFLYRELNRLLTDQPADQMMALLLIDLNHFKDLNDSLGHQAGDNLLKQLGPRLIDELQDENSIVAHLGGDEFAVFLPQVRNAQKAVVVAHRMMDTIKRPFDLDGFHSEIGAAIGVSLRPQQASDVSTLMRYADVAMQNAKAQFTGIAIYNTDSDPHSPKRFSLMNELRRAIRESELFLHFQPKIELNANRLHGFEALLRWNHPTHGFVSPAEFIPMAEKTDIIHPLTHWVLENSIAQCRKWHDQGFYVTVAVNLSTRNLLDEKLAKKLEELLRKYDLPALSLELEITESSIMSDPTRALVLLQQISDLGVRLSIDDYGTGYSSLAYIKRLPVQALKIDYSFILNMLSDSQDEVIVNSTINLAHNLGLDVVAEGVENQETLDRLAAMGCNQAQGYFMGRPMSVAAVAEWYETSSWRADEQGDEV